MIVKMAAKQLSSFAGNDAVARAQNTATAAPKTIPMMLQKKRKATTKHGDIDNTGRNKRGNKWKGRPKQAWKQQEMAEVRKVKEAEHLLKEREIMAKEAEAAVNMLKVEEELSVMHGRAIFEEQKIKNEEELLYEQKKQ
jgi:hypothetical protein